ncbi:transglycosylase family protein [Frankia nepalensis]|uniref:transglycosylase family protein n=1 Tax=Frankia nepalensis TaxID=1836974 RepID=UPI00396A7A1B
MPGGRFAPPSADRPTAGTTGARGRASSPTARTAPPARREPRRSRPAVTGPNRRLRQTLAAAPVIAAAVGGTLALASPANASSNWAELRQCESGGNYSINTRNGYYGAYQFSLSTWRSLGYSGLPSDAPPAVQDEAALRLAQRSGFGQWPVCGRGMGPDQLAPGASSPAPPAPPAPQAAPVVPLSLVVQPASTTLARLPFTTALVGEYRADVASWQARMNEIGYPLAVDGHYGPLSAAAASSLQAAKGLAVDGAVGPETWSATFT